MKFITALGNPGEKYSLTRHNIGFMVIDEFASINGFSFKFEKKFNAEIAKGIFNNENILICKPQTFMNLSGEAVRPLIEYYKISIDDFFLVYDDISLDLGKVRFRAKGSDGGHNGVKSVIQYIKTDKFARLKVGIGPQPQFMKSEVFVLSNFNSEQKDLLQATIKFASNAIAEYLQNGIQIAQNKYN
ncbi:aminoacyl-tRNA hydrolase [bacterium]|nr:aminoacyl-tRNA hydrolase [bacterium]